MIVRAVVLSCLVGFAACSELPPVPHGQCGNGVVEPFEDCDEPSPLCVQCRRLCNRETAVEVGTCPEAYACGVDDVCSAPGAQFEPPATSFAFPVQGYRITDVDHDRYGDVVGLTQSALFTRYGDARGELNQSSIVVTPPLLGAPALTHLEDPAIDDLVLPVADGLVAYTGALGMPSPRQFPINTAGGIGPDGRPEPVDVVQVDKTIAAFGARSRTDLRITASMMSLTAGYPTFEAEIEDVCGTGDMFVATSFVHDSIVSYRSSRGTYLAFKPSSAVVCVIEVSRDALSQEYTLRPLASYPAFDRYVLVDLDDDGCPSLLDGDGGARSLLEYAGTADGDDACQLASTTSPLLLPDEPADSELIGYITLDPPVAGRLADALITSYSILALDPSYAPRPLYRSDRPVERVITGDVNGDGLVDAVLTTSFPNIDLARRVPGDDRFLLSRWSTVGAVTETVIGDFDGDTRNDLAYSERLGSADQLSIAYGTPGGLLPGIAVDAFKALQFLAVMEVVNSADPFNIVDDLLAVDVEIVPGSVPLAPEITLLHGSSNRTMLSFYGPPVPNPGAPFRGVVAGNFVETGDSAGKLDLLAFQTQAGPTLVHVIPGLPRARLGDPLFHTNFLDLPTVPQAGSCVPPLPEFCLDLAAFSAFEADGKPDVILGIDARPGAPTVLRAEITPTGPVFTTQTGVFPPRGRPRNLEGIDIDHDGRRELVVSFTPGDDAPQAHVAICRLSANAEIVECLDVAQDVLGDPTLECTSFARGDVTPPCERGDDRPAIGEDLVVACRRGVGPAVVSSVFHIREQGGALASWRVLLEEPNLDFADIQLGDVSGDGIDDLVVLVATGGISQLQVRKQRASRDTNLCFD